MKPCHRALWVLALASMFLAGNPDSAWAVIRHARPTPTGAGTGVDWDNATTLQAAINAAGSGDEIRVAAGTYLPTQQNDAGDVRSKSFIIVSKNNLMIKGGYRASGGLDTERDPANPAFYSILSGDLGALGNAADNAYNVVTIRTVNASVVLDGLRITDGNAGGPGAPLTRGLSQTSTGGGTYIFQANPTIRNCTYFENQASVGGAIGAYGSPTIEDCTFFDNAADNGGALYIEPFNPAVSPQVRRSSFTQNTATLFGGAVYTAANGTPRYSSCQFLNNTALGDGGAFYNLATGVLVNCLFAGNDADNGGAFYNLQNNPDLINCTFSANNASGAGANDGQGGAIYVLSGLVRVFNSILWDNDALNAVSDQDTEIFRLAGNAVVEYTDIQGGWTGPGGAGNLDRDPRFVSDFMRGGSGDFRLTVKSPCIDRGLDAYLPGGVTTDLSGLDRFENTVDMGAYEFQCDSIPLQSRLYVDQNVAGGPGNGTSWDEAFDDLQSALFFAQCSNADPALTDVEEIWVAKGIYTPDEGPSDPANQVARASSFSLVNSLELYGAFPTGGGDGSFLARNPDDAAFATVLSGDINGDDDSGGTNEENAYHVVVADGIGDVVVDGFTIAGGRADGPEPDQVFGAGLLALSSDLFIRRCTFRDNHAVENGAGLFSFDASLELVSCSFANNESGNDGGGAYVIIEDPLLLRGADVPFRATNSVFELNTADDGAGLYLDLDDVAADLVQCVFVANQAADDGGGLYVHADTDETTRLTNCTIAGNSAEFGGGIYHDSGDLHLVNTLLWANVGTGNPLRGGDDVLDDQLETDDEDNLFVEYSCIQDEAEGDGNVGFGGSANNNVDSDPLFFANPSPGDVGDLRLSGGSGVADLGNDDALPPDEYDLDDNGDTAETLPVDIAGTDRVFGGAVDIGAYELECIPPKQPIIYVDLTAVDGLDDGTSWENAYLRLSDALCAAAGSEIIEEIWVAKGTYTPSPGGNSRSRSFRIPDGVKIFGGFMGGETERNQRDCNPATNQTVLSGDLNGDDDTAGKDENSFHVLTTTAGVVDTENTLVNGFTIRGGNANGGGLNSLGGGLLNQGGSPTFAMCIFEENCADYGGAVFSSAGAPRFFNSFLRGNVANLAGGAVFNAAGEPLLSQCVLVSNFSDAPVIARGGASGGGAWYNESGNPQIQSCTFAGNVATSLGGGWLNAGGNPSLVNSILWGHEDSNGTGESSQLHVLGGTPNVNFCCIQGLTGGFGGFGNIGDDPLFKDPPTLGHYGDVRLGGKSTVIDKGSNDFIPLDLGDIDKDGDTAEPLPQDLFGFLRVWYDTIDPGAYESPSSPVPGRRYVDAKVKDSGMNNGLTWPCAYIDLQDALDEAAQPGSEVREIWVAANTYYPDRGTADRNATFPLLNGVEMYGGFTGDEYEVFFELRNVPQNVTILCGDIGEPGNKTDNAYHVLTATPLVTRATRLDGFTIRDGNASGPLTTPLSRGGGLYNNNGDPTIVNCVFYNNCAVLYGGAIFNFNRARPLLVNTRLAGNMASSSGAGIYDEQSDCTIVNCVFSGNVAGQYGAGIFENDSDSLIINCSFGGNRANSTGGALFVVHANSRPVVRNSILWQNMPQQIVVSSGLLTISDSIVQGGYAGANILNANPIFLDLDGPDNVPGSPDDNLRLGMFSPAIDAGADAWLPEDDADTDYDGDVLETIPHDADNLARIVGAKVDLGAYESVPVELGNILYVDDTATGAANGRTWPDALTELQTALAIAKNSAGLVTQIWVAEGVYYPDAGTGNRADAFRLLDGVALYGGFPDGGMVAPAKEDFYSDLTPLLTVVSQLTITISDDLHFSDGGLMTSFDLGYYNTISAGDAHVIVFFFENNADAVPPDQFLAFFEFALPPADEAVIHHDLAVPVALPQNVWMGLSFSSFAGPLVSTSMPTAGTSHNLLYNHVDEAFIADQDPAANLVLAVSGIRGSAEATLDDRDTCTYRTVLCGDLLGNDGPAFANRSDNSRHVVIIDGNNATAVLDGFVIRGGNADAASGTDSFGGGVLCTNADAMIRLCKFEDNLAKTRGGGLYVTGGEPGVLGCWFDANSSQRGGGAYVADSFALISHGTFRGNVATYGGGGLSCFDTSPDVLNCLFTGNRAALYGGGLLCETASPVLINATFSLNRAAAGGAFFSQGSLSQPQVVNSILWGNLPNQISVTAGSTPAVAYTCIQGGWGGLGAFNITDDPLFRDANGADDVDGTEDDNARLMTGSPCINAASNVNALGIATDLDGFARVHDGVVDMGAYEYRPGEKDDSGDPDQPAPCGCGDLNGDGLVNLTDFTSFAPCFALTSPDADCPPPVFACSDLNQDGVINLVDFNTLAAVFGQPPVSSPPNCK